MSYIDERVKKVKLELRVSTKSVMTSFGEREETRLFCKKCDSDLTNIVNDFERGYDLDYCPHCGIDLRGGHDGRGIG